VCFLPEKFRGCRRNDTRQKSTSVLETGNYGIYLSNQLGLYPLPPSELWPVTAAQGRRRLRASRRCITSIEGITANSVYITPGHSFLRATTGSTAVALRAGSTEARATITIASPSAHVKLIGSNGLTPYNWLRRQCASTTVPGSATKIPAPAIQAISPTTNPTTRRRGEPRAKRTPISRVRP